MNTDPKQGRTVERTKGEYPANPPKGKTGKTGKWWESTNFFASALLFIAGLWGLNSGEFDTAVKGFVMQIYTLIGTGGILRTFIVNAKFNPGQWLGNKNTYQYLVAILVSIIPNLPADAGDKLYDFVQAVKTGNIGIIISAAVTLAVFIWNVWKSQPGKAPAGGNG